MMALEKARGAHRKAVELLYEGTCTITIYESYLKPNKATGHREVIVLEDEPCRLSYNGFPAAEKGETGATKQQSIKLFLPPEIDVVPGSKITVTQNGVTEDYCRSGQPAVYATHQEVELDLWKGWT
ncbi:hypothetical protein AALA24_02140 [Anaerovoracaceae bacterium 42-11]